MVLVEAKNFACSLGAVEDHSRKKVRSDPVKAEREGCNHSEVAAPAANSPEKINIFILGGTDPLAGCGHHFHCGKVVDGEACRRIRWPMPPPNVRPAIPSWC